MSVSLWSLEILGPPIKDILLRAFAADHVQTIAKITVFMKCFWFMGVTSLGSLRLSSLLPCPTSQQALLDERWRKPYFVVSLGPQRLSVGVSLWLLYVVPGSCRPITQASEHLLREHMKNIAEQVGKAMRISSKSDSYS